MPRILPRFIWVVGLALVISIPSLSISASAQQDIQDQPSALPVPAIQEPAIGELPPAMNLLAPIPISQAQSSTAAQTQSGAQNPPANSALPKVKTFTGTVEKGHDGYFLKGVDGTYRLDDSDKVASYDGRKVQIVGRLELDTNLIHIDRIEAAR